MFETSTNLPNSARAAGPGKTSASPRRFPIEHEAEFAEVQAGASATGFVSTALFTGLLFHALLIAERHYLGFSPRSFALRGGPVTLCLLVLMLLPSQLHRQARVLLCLTSWAAAMALLAGLNITDPAGLFSLETGVAALLLLTGWTAQLPLLWTGLLAGGTLLVNAAVLVSSPGAPITRLDALFAPGFAAAFTLLSAWVRREEARREFLAVRTAAFAGTEIETPDEDERHLDPETGVGNRTAFDMRLRAAWEQAAKRRNSVALLMFSIDDFAQKKRDFGYKYAEMLQTQVAGMLKEGLRRSDDMVARFDVHHFVVMLPGVGTDGATQIAERLRGCIEELVIYSGAERRRATVTVGVASLRAKRGVERDRLIECTVQALEQAKQMGANTVCVEGRGCLPRMV